MEPDPRVVKARERRIANIKKAQKTVHPLERENLKIFVEKQKEKQKVEQASVLKDLKKQMERSMRKEGTLLKGQQLTDEEVWNEYCTRKAKGGDILAQGKEKDDGDLFSGSVVSPGFAAEMKLSDTMTFSDELPGRKKGREDADRPTSPKPDDEVAELPKETRTVRKKGLPSPFIKDPRKKQPRPEKAAVEREDAMNSRNTYTAFASTNTKTCAPVSAQSEANAGMCKPTGSAAGGSNSRSPAKKSDRTSGEEPRRRSQFMTFEESRARNSLFIPDHDNEKGRKNAVRSKDRSKIRKAEHETSTTVTRKKPSHDAERAKTHKRKQLIFSDSSSEDEVVAPDSRSIPNVLSEEVSKTNMRKKQKTGAHGSDASMETLVDQVEKTEGARIKEDDAAADELHGVTLTRTSVTIGLRAKYDSDATDIKRDSSVAWGSRVRDPRPI